MTSRIVFTEPLFEGTAEVVPVIDGVDLIRRVTEFERTAGMDPAGGYAGLIPARYPFGPAGDHSFAANAFSSKPGMTPVLGCDCGEWACWPLWTRIAFTENDVTWHDFEQPYRPDRDYSGFEPFTFDLAEYEAAVAALEPAWSTA